MDAPLRLWCDSVARQLRHARLATRQWLSRDEEQRLRAFTSQRRRDQFVAGRWLARQALVALHGGEPHDWCLSAPQDAAPEVDGGPFIGLSHSGDVVACVISEERVGLDVESAQRRALDVQAIAELSLNDDERIAVLAAVDPFGAYLVRWTLKEAFIKARGGRPNLPDISTAPSIAAMANARVWQLPGVTIALVGVRAGVSVDLAGHMAPHATPTTWHVALTPLTSA